MTLSCSKLLPSVGLHLIPFFSTIVLYFGLFIPDSQPSVWAMFIKCIPIISLMIFVVLQRRSYRKEDSFSRCILWGLIFSCGGDAFLIWPQTFLHGMASFGVAHIFYIRAFGFQTLSLSIAVPYFSACIYVLTILLKNASDEFVIGVPIYTLLLVSTAWRASARVQESSTWIRICGCIGTVSFVASDTCIAYDKFYAPLPSAQVWIMTTYYLAQFGIALSILENANHNKSVQSAKDNKKHVKTSLSKTDKRLTGKVK